MTSFPTSWQFVVILLLVGSVIAQRSCPLGKFCNIEAGSCSNNDTSQCVETCPTNADRLKQGNWTTGNCERGKDSV